MGISDHAQEALGDVVFVELLNLVKSLRQKVKLELLSPLRQLQIYTHLSLALYVQLTSS